MHEAWCEHWFALGGLGRVPHATRFCRMGPFMDLSLFGFQKASLAAPRIWACVLALFSGFSFLLSASALSGARARLRDGSASAMHWSHLHFPQRSQQISGSRRSQQISGSRSVSSFPIGTSADSSPLRALGERVPAALQVSSVAQSADPGQHAFPSPALLSL